MNISNERMKAGVPSPGPTSKSGSSDSSDMRVASLYTAAGAPAAQRKRVATPRETATEDDSRTQSTQSTSNQGLLHFAEMSDLSRLQRHVER